MKKLLIILFASAVLYSCGSNDGEAGNTDNAASGDTAAPAPDAAGGSAIANEKGLELIGASDCTSCHSINDKLIGPAYVEVAKKYEDTDQVIDTLVSKVINGGTGNWGNIPMTPHPQLSKEDAREMVKYILTLDKQQ